MPPALPYVLLPAGEKVLQLAPGAELSVFGGGLEEPVVLPHIEELDRPEADQHADEVAPEEIQEQVIPPALRKVVQPHLHGPFQNFKEYGARPGNHTVPENPGLNGPPEEVSSHKHIHGASDVSEVGGLVLGGVYPAVLSIASFREGDAESVIKNIL